MQTHWRKSVTAITLGLVLLSAQLSQAQALNFYKNYFVTGDYEVGGVGLSSTGINGIATGTINISGVDPEAEILAAFLYWQVVAKKSDGPDSGIEGATFNGFPLSTPDGPLALVLDSGGTSPCWSSGGGTGNGGAKRTYTYRADVLRFIGIDETTGRHVVNGPHTIQVPDSGSGNGTPNALGASLVVVYRDPNPSTPLAAIVIYDGGYTVDNSTPSMSQTIAGFYDPASSPMYPGKLTHIVGSGQANKGERILVNGVEYTDAFAASEGPNWDNVTFDDFAAPSGGTLTTSVDDVGVGSSDCLTWGAIIYRTEVNDSDGDGLLDMWESVDFSGQLSDPNGTPLPDLYAMGALDNQKDIFIEVDHMWADPDPSRDDDVVYYGSEAKPEHTHLPTAAALQMMGDAFAAQGIRVHFDVGNNYQFGEVSSNYIVPMGLAQGGDAMNEMDTVCVRDETANPPDAPWVCQFSDYPGTVGWKSGFRFFKEENFDPIRKDMFHYALFAHALGIPKASCLVTDPESIDFGYPDLECMDTDANYHVPQSFTGVADFPGGDILVTLGGFDDLYGRPVGTDFWVASTLMHELGHNLALRHGGDRLEPNCKPNYLSVMNYLFQLRGLIDDDGVPHLDFSSQTLFGFDENGLSDPGPLGSLFYRTAWYAPKAAGTIGDILDLTAATRHCDGSPLLTNELGELVEPPMVRLDATGVSDNLDWNGNGADGSLYPQDINFDGFFESLNESHDDWANIRLNQVGSRRNVGGWFLVEDPATGDFVAFMGPLSLDTGRGDLGRGDLGRGDLGRGDLGRGDLGRGDLGRGDLGRGDLGRGDLGRGDLGRGDLGRGDLGRGDLGRGDLGRGDLGVGADDGLFELDKGLARELANSPANELRASVIYDGCDGSSPADCHRIRLDWKASHIGSVKKYFVYRFEGATLPPVSVDFVGEVPFGAGQVEYSLIDNEELPNGEFTYYVKAEFNDNTLSNPSIFVTITAINDEPMADDDVDYITGAGMPLTVDAAQGVLANDEDVDSVTLTVELVDGSGPSGGTLMLSDDGSFTYTPNSGFAGPDTFTYRANDVDLNRNPITTSEATVTITVQDVTPPVVTLSVPTATGGGGFFKTAPVGVTVSATDPSGVASFECLDNGEPISTGNLNGIGTLDASGIFNVSGEGAHDLICTATDGLGNSGAASGSTNTGIVKIDTVPPVITIAAPVDDAEYVLNSSVASDYACSDDAPGSGVDTCSGTVSSGSSFDTSTVGLNNFTVTATDVAGNSATKTTNYHVIYNVTLAPLKKTAKLGSAVQVEYVLQDGTGSVISDLSTLVKMESVYNGPASGGCVPSEVGIRETLFSFPEGATGNSSFRFLNPPFRLNWDTTTATVTGEGCYTVLIYLDDKPDTPRMTTATNLK